MSAPWSTEQVQQYLTKWKVPAALNTATSRAIKSGGAEPLLAIADALRELRRETGEPPRSRM